VPTEPESEPTTASTSAPAPAPALAGQAATPAGQTATPTGQAATPVGSGSRPGSVPAVGYDPAFLGPLVPLPGTPGHVVHELPYEHFTVLLDPVRRLARATVVAIDGAALVDVDRGDDWHLDPRVPADDQAGPEVYARNDLDRGHLVRRRDPVWGDRATAERANRDTFAYPNAAPQASGFNQSAELWLGLEDHVLDSARAHRRRLVVLTQPVLGDDDPPYRGVRVPLLFTKVVVWADAAAERGLRTAAFLLDQSPALDVDELRRGALDGVPPLGPFRTFQVPVAGVAELTGLDLGQLVDTDVLAPLPTAGRPTGPAADRRPLRALVDVVL